MKSIPTKPLLRQVPAPVRAALERIRENGHRALLAGGCVRDLLLKRPPKDWDIVSDASLGALKVLFPHHIDAGVAFGILKLPPLDGVSMDIAMFRAESGYSDSRRPDAVTAGDLPADQSRRDFTINALYLDIFSGEIIDGVGGLKDLRRRVIRSVGDALLRFDEDGLRVLRALRFAAQLGFKIEPATLRAVKARRGKLSLISRERIREETVKAFSSARPALFLNLVAKQGLWPQVFGGRPPGPAVLRRWARLKAPKGAGPEAWFAALAAAGSCDDLRGRLKLSNAEEKLCDRVAAFLAAGWSRSRFPAAAAEAYVELERQHPGLMAFAAKAALPRPPTPLAKAIARLTKLARAKKPVRWPQGADLLKEGFTPGPDLGRELHRRGWAAFAGS